MESDGTRRNHEVWPRGTGRFDQAGHLYLSRHPVESVCRTTRVTMKYICTFYEGCKGELEMLEENIQCYHVRSAGAIDMSPRL